MKKFIACILAVLLFVMVFAGCDFSQANEPTWEDYQNWLVDTFADYYSDPASFESAVLALRSWSDVNTNSSPWNEIFGESYYNASTWDEFCALGRGTYTPDYRTVGTVAAVSGGSASGETTTTAAAGSGEMAAGGTAPASTSTAATGTTPAAPGAGAQTAGAGGASK